MLIALYLIAATAGFLLLTASVVKQIFFRRSNVGLSKLSVVTDNPGPRELLECHDLVLEQFTQLNIKTSELYKRPLQGAAEAGTTNAQAWGRTPSERRSAWRSDWKNFSTQWRDQWELIDARCRFAELAETNLGAAYDQMAQVHEALPAMRLKYNRLIADFDKEQADELRQMRQMLNDSHNTISRQLQRTPDAPTKERVGTEGQTP